MKRAQCRYCQVLWPATRTCSNPLRRGRVACYLCKCRLPDFGTQIEITNFAAPLQRSWLDFGITCGGSCCCSLRGPGREPDREGLFRRTRMRKNEEGPMDFRPS